MFFSKEYILILILLGLGFLLIYINPSFFQNKRYKRGGDACPNALWHTLILFVIGTVLFYLMNRYAEYLPF